MIGLMNIFFRNKREYYYIARKMVTKNAIDTNMLNIRVPNNFGRCPKGLFMYSGAWKGRLTKCISIAIYYVVTYIYRYLQIFTVSKFIHIYCCYIFFHIFTDIYRYLQDIYRYLRFQNSSIAI